MERLRVYFLLVQLHFCCACHFETYSGYQLWRIKNIDEDSVPDLLYLIDGVQLNVWSSGPSWMDVVVPPYLLYSLDDSLQCQGFVKEVLIEDIQSKIDQEIRITSSGSNAGVNIATYNQIEEIETFMHELADSIEWVTVETLGKTSEGRDLLVNKLSVSQNVSSKPSVWIDCGIHPREWITTATCLYGLRYLVESYEISDEFSEFLETYDVYVMPLQNPDGYFHTWHVDRLWNKNRSPTVRGCHGVDLDRNYDSNWETDRFAHYPYSDLFQGTEVFSETESKAVRDFVTQLFAEQNLTAFFTLQSYGQVWMRPSTTIIQSVADSEEQIRVSEVGINALYEYHNTSYQIGSTDNALYTLRGTSVDWAYSIGIVHAYKLLLKDTGRTAFMVPDKEIVPSSEETWHGIVEAIMAI